MTDPFAVADPLLARQIQTLSDGRRTQAIDLARLHFRNFMAELFAGDILSTFDPPVVPDWPQLDHAHRVQGGMPKLNVPLGKIFWTKAANDLPVIGLVIPKDARPPDLIAGFGAFATAQHSAPFCRPVFVTQRLDILPFLGRYGFALHHQWPPITETDFGYLSHRHDLTQGRDLLDGTLIWKR